MFNSEEAQQMAQDLDSSTGPKAGPQPSAGRKERTHPLENAPKRQGMGRRAESRMRITKRQLRRIIKEEKRRLMTESLQATEEKLFHALDEYVGALEERSSTFRPSLDETKVEVLNFIDGYFEDAAYAEEQAKREEGQGR